jgi:hypothetical protein
VVYRSVERLKHSNCKRQNVPPRCTFSQRGSCPIASSKDSFFTPVGLYWYTAAFIQVLHMYRNRLRIHHWLVHGCIEAISLEPRAIFRVSVFSTLAEQRLCVLRTGLVLRACTMYPFSVLVRLALQRAQQSPAEPSRAQQSPAPQAQARAPQLRSICLCITRNTGHVICPRLCRYFGRGGFLTCTVREVLPLICSF